MEAGRALRAGSITSDELTSACLERIRQRDHAFSAWLHVDEQDALVRARAADRVISDGGGGPLTGIPIGLKDLIGVAGRPLTGDSALLAGNVAAADSVVWEGLDTAGMVLLGHLHCGELACGTWGSNPWGAALSPGGSSSGSGIALATRTVPATIGTDTRGSIRMPAAYLNCTAVKPTFGLVSLAGCITTSFTYDVVGPMARSAADCALLLAAIAGPDGRDRATLTQPRSPDYAVEPVTGQRPLRQLRLGLPALRNGSVADGVANVWQRVGEELARLGATLVRFDRPRNPLEVAGGSEAGWKTILGAEATAHHAQFTGRRHLHRPEFRRLFREVADPPASALDYVQAQIKRSELAATWRALFAEHRLDAVLEPAAPGGVPPRRSGDQVAQDEVVDAETLVGTWNDTNFPVLSLPAGLSAEGVPVGMQLVGLPFAERRLLEIAVQFQAATAHHTIVPPGLDDVRPSARVAEEPQPSAPQPAYRTLRSPLEVLFPVEGGGRDVRRR